MSIRNFCGVPDHLVPEWVLRSRERRRADRLKLCSCNLHFATRAEVLAHCEEAGHAPLVA